jgi:hypothetical protein
MVLLHWQKRCSATSQNGRLGPNIHLSVSVGIGWRFDYLLYEKLASEKTISLVIKSISS